MIIAVIEVKAIIMIVVTTMRIRKEGTYNHPARTRAALNHT